ncbi:hypothetical protein C4K40_2248 [Pseudomonas sp. CMR5c]|nr:hypothetical protein C4K40_2248 [Pseudomonas sp. CMR5c]
MLVISKPSMVADKQTASRAIRFLDDAIAIIARFTPIDSARVKVTPGRLGSAEQALVILSATK